MIQLHKLLGFFPLKGISKTPSRHANISPEMLQSAIERVVEGTEPRIRLVRGYQKKLQESVSVALAYIDGLVETLPSPIETNKKSFADDPLVSAFFTSAEELQNVFSQSTELRNYFSKYNNGQQSDAYALLCMNESEKTVMGVELQGDMLRRDVLQTAVNFSNHQILSPAASEAEIRRCLKQCIFDGLITHALQQIASSKLLKSELEDQRRILHARLRGRLAQGTGLTAILAAAADDADQLGAQLAATEEQLKNLPAHHNAPQAYMQEVHDVLMHPETFIQLNHIELTLTRMCIKVNGETTEPCNTIHLHQIEIPGVLKRVIALVHYPRREMLTVEEGR